MGRKDGQKKNIGSESTNEENTTNNSSAQVHDEEASAEPHVASLAKVLEEIWDFHKDTTNKLN